MKKIVLLFILLIPLIFVLMLQFGNPISKYIVEPIVEKEIIEYLEMNGYSKGIIKILKPYYGKPKISGSYDPRFLVVFEDEPNVAYFYLKKYNGKIAQLCYTESYSETNSIITIPSHSKHLEDRCIKVK